MLNLFLKNVLTSYKIGIKLKRLYKVILDYKETFLKVPLFKIGS